MTGSFAVCRFCEGDAAWSITAAYPACDVIHPHYATYPAPMFYVCGGHLATAMEGDLAAPGSTPAHLVKRVQR